MRSRIARSSLSSAACAAAAKRVEQRRKQATLFLTATYGERRRVAGDVADEQCHLRFGGPSTRGERPLVGFELAARGRGTQLEVREEGHQSIGGRYWLHFR